MEYSKGLRAARGQPPKDQPTEPSIDSSPEGTITEIDLAAGGALSYTTQQHTPADSSLQSEKPELNMASAYGTGGGYATAIGVGVIFFGLVVVLSPFLLPIWAVATGLSMLAAFVLTRHFSVKMKQKKTIGRIWMAASDRYPGPDTSYLPAVYFLYVLGSGGHTTEMVEMIRHKFRGNMNLHRRYLTTTGDQHSKNKELELEATIRHAYVGGAAGTYDTLLVTRARAVHQSYFTSVFTTLMCAFEIIAALTMLPENRPKKKFGEKYRHPHVVVTNGPGTGFVVCLVAHLLKIFYLAPEDRLKLVYIESWARVKSLSLTGKLFHWTGIADLFLVQSDSLARSTGKKSIGNVSVRTTPVGLDYGRREAWPRDNIPPSSAELEAERGMAEREAVLFS